MKKLMFFVGFSLCLIAALASPIAIGLFLHSWAIQDYPIALAAWEAFKSWICLLLAVVPGAFFMALAE